jgi:hypothetical protein
MSCMSRAFRCSGYCFVTTVTKVRHLTIPGCYCDLKSN